MSGGTATARAGRNSKPNKPPTVHSPTKAESAAKNMPSAEQMRMAHMTSDKKGKTDPETEQKVNQVMELTGKSFDDVIIALHDCDGDPNKAANMLLEGDGDQGEWKTTEKKKKRSQQSGASEDQIVNHKSDRRDEKSRERDRADREREPRERNESSSRGGRMRATIPPRLARGRGKENDDSRSRDRSFERGKGRGRGQMNGPGRGRGRGGGGRRFERGGRFENSRNSGDDTGPRIDTWTNETAESEKKKDSWDMDNDWTVDEWQGGLEESKVFTAKSTGGDSRFPGPGIGDNDASVFHSPPNSMTMESSVFSNSVGPAATNGSMLLGDSSPLSHSGVLPPSASPGLSQGTGLGQSSGLGQGSGLGQSPSLGQRLGLGMLGLNDKPNHEAPVSSHTQPHAPQQSHQFMSQFAKQATESIKNAVGIGTSSPSNQSPSPASGPPPSQPTLPVGNAANQAPMQQRTTKPQRSKLPPPSKIPASAVEMPGHMVKFPLDVQFGNWDLNNESASYGNFSSAEPPSTGAGFPVAGANSGGGLSSLSHVNKSDLSSSVMTNATASKSSVAGLESLSGSGQGQMPSVFPNSTPTTTPTKDFSQANKISPPDPIPFPSDRKSPYAPQRQTQTPGSLGSNTSSSPSQMPSFSQSGYSSSYPTSSFKTGNGLNSSGLSSSQNQYTAQNYQSSSFQPQASFSSSQNQSSLYQGSSASNSFPGQSGAYQSQSGASFSRDGQTSFQQPTSQPTASYASERSQASTAYQSGGSQPTQGFPTGGQSVSFSSSGSQSAPSYQTSTTQSSSVFPNSSGQTASSYHSSSSSVMTTYDNSASQSGQSFQTSVSQSTGGSFQTDTQTRQSSFGSPPSYGSSNHQNAAMPSAKLSDSLGKMSVKDSTLDGQTSQFDSGSTSTTSLTTTTTTASSSLSGTSVSVSATIGLSAPASVSSAVSTTSSLPTTKSSSVPSSKAPPGVPPGVPPLIGASYLMGQPGTMPFAAAAFANLAAQPPVYGYEDLQLLQQRLPLPGYYDMQFQPTTTLAPARDQTGLSSVAYTGADGKLNRVEAQSPVQGQTTQQTSQQGVSAQQPFLNPQALPAAAYSYYYPGGLLPTGYSYTPAVFPMPSVTNAAHAGTTGNPQYQKTNVNAFSHTYGTSNITYDDLTQGQDFSKAAYGGASQTQNKVAAAAAGVGGVSSAADLAGAGYGKTHSTSFDKAGFHNNTPPPFNLALPTGTQAGPMGGQPTAYTPYVPMMAQPHSQMLHHQLTHDTSGATSRASQPSASQTKAGGTKNYSTGYWGAN